MVLMLSLLVVYFKQLQTLCDVCFVFVFFREDSNKAEDQALWKAIQDDEVDEMRGEYEEDYRGEIERYRTQLATWKEHNKLQVMQDTLSY